MVLSVTTLVNNGNTIKTVFSKLRQIDEFEVIIPIIAAIITFVNCKL